MNKLTKHGKERINQRVDNNYSNKHSLLGIVRKKGAGISQFEGEFYQYLHNKTLKGCKVKVYQDKIYILSKNSNRLITVYAVPSKYIPVEKYKLNEKLAFLSRRVGYLIDKPINIKIKRDTKEQENNYEEVKGYIIKINKHMNKMVSLYVRKYNNNTEIIEFSKILEIDLDVDYITQNVAREMGIVL